MKQPFRTAELKAELERALGCVLLPLVRLKCVNALNFKAVRKSDGFVFTVKCIPEWQQSSYERIERHLAELKGSLSVQRVFEGSCPKSFGGFRLICLTWCRGGALFPDALTDGQFRIFLEDYLVFSRALQGTTLIEDPYPADEWRKEALAKCNSGWGWLVRPFVLDCREDESAFRSEFLHIMHGDLHPGNFAFDNGRVSGFFDIEGLTKGYPAWDFIRYFAFALDHVGLFGRKRKMRILMRFAEAVRLLPYSRDEWIVSINVHWLEQITKKLNRPKIGLLSAVQLYLKGRLYRKLRAIAVQARSDRSACA